MTVQRSARAKASANFHDRVRASCWDNLAGELLNLHAPHLQEGLPVCRGCDRDRTGTEDVDPVWPCRTYTLIAKVLLSIEDVESALGAAGRRSSRRTASITLSITDIEESLES